MTKYRIFILRSLPWLAIALVFGIAMLIRYGLIEPVVTAQACDAGRQSVDCLIRHLAILTFDHQQLGYASIIIGLLSVVTRSAWIAWSAAVISAAGLVWYCFEPCAIGLVLSILVLARTQIRQPHRQAERNA